jgi:hypothetical protein
LSEIAESNRKYDGLPEPRTALLKKLNGIYKTIETVTIKHQS